MQPESPQTFEVTASRTSRLVNLGFSFVKLFFSSASVVLLINL